jgi:hypothetical protein
MVFRRSKSLDNQPLSQNHLGKKRKPAQGETSWERTGPEWTGEAFASRLSQRQRESQSFEQFVEIQDVLALLGSRKIPRRFVAVLLRHITAAENGLQRSEILAGVLADVHGGLPCNVEPVSG